VGALDEAGELAAAGGGVAVSSARTCPEGICPSKASMAIPTQAYAARDFTSKSYARRPV